MPYIPPPEFKDAATTRKSAVRSRAEELVAQAVDMKRGLDAAQSKADELKSEYESFFADELEPALLAAGISDNVTFRYGKANIRVCDEGSGSRIDEQLLINAGVSKSIIDKAKVENKRKHYLKIEFPEERKDAKSAAEQARKGARR